MDSETNKLISSLEKQVNDLEKRIIKLEPDYKIPDPAYGAESQTIAIGGKIVNIPDLNQVVIDMDFNDKKLGIIHGSGEVQFSKRESELVYAAFNSTIRLIVELNRNR